jgi:TP901 family phage tail tape measure protein
MSTLMEAVVRLRPDMDQFQKEATSGVTDSLDRIGAGAEKAGRRVTRSATLPIIALGTASVKMAVDFDTSFRKIEGLVGVTGSDLEQLREAAQRLGPQFGKSGGEAAEALFFITSAGLRGQDAIDALERSLMAGAVGLGEVSTIADLTTSVMNAYKDSNMTAAQATDVLTAAVREGKLEPAELAGAMGQVLPIASAMGIGFDEVGAAFAAMSRTGTNAAAASTQLRGIMTSILNPTKGAEEALEGMGLSSEGLRQQIREKGLLSVLETLTEKFDGNEAAAASVFGNVRALSGVMDLMGGNADGTREIFANMSDTTGMLGDAFNIVQEGPAFEFAQTMADLKSIMAELGAIVLPIVRDIAVVFRDLFQRFKDLSPEQKEMAVRFLAVVAAVGPALIIFGKLVTGISAVIKVIKFMNLALMANPWVLLIAAVIAFGVWIYKNREMIGEYVRKIGEWFSGLGQKVGGVFTRIGDTIRNVFRSAVDFVKGMINRLLGYWEGIINGPATAANALIRVANRIPGVNVPELPRVSIPRLADGGDITRGGRVMVGEEGPEYLDLPRGARVTPLDKSGGDVNIHMQVTVQGGNFDEDKLVRALDRLARDAAATGTYRRPE